jgi:uncharacterized protein (TIGR00266 family)
MLRVDLEEGEEVIAETGAMVARDPQIAMDVRLNAGTRRGLFARIWAFFVALVRKLVGGETFFVNAFSAPSAGRLWLAPRLAGQIRHVRLEGGSLVLSRGAFLASRGDLSMRVRFGGLRALLARKGIFFLEITGEGDLWFNSYGGVHEVEVKGRYIVDNGHLVGYDRSLTLRIRSAGGGLLGLLASGEGLVCELEGEGKVYLQSRSVRALVDWLEPFLPS